MAHRLLTGGECPQGVLDVVEGAIGYLALSNGYTSIQYAALRILANMFLSFTEDIGASALSHAELAGRTSILLSDIVLALLDAGFDLRSLEELPRRRQYRGFKEPSVIGPSTSRGVTSSAVVGPNGLTIIPKPLSFRSEWSGGSSARSAALHNVSQAGGDHTIAPPPAPAHLQLPALPEPHTFVHTRVKRPPPCPDPTALRRRAADQRRKVQQSLIQFLSRIRPVQYMFPGDPESFMLITPTKHSRPYLPALLATGFEPGSEDYQHTHPPTDLRHASHPITSSSASLTVLARATTAGMSINPYLMKPKFPDY